MLPKRLYLITGKGGAGKTISSLALAHHLKKNGHKVLLVDFDQGIQNQLCEKLNIHYQRLELLKIFEQYVNLKLGSKLLAAWVARSEFLKSVLNVVPGMSYLFYLGYLLQLLREDSQLTIVLDSPSSGHVLTMLESIKNYREILRQGTVFDDVEIMQEFISDPNTLRILICNIPTQLSLSEGMELKSHLEDFSYNDIHMFLNLFLPLNTSSLKQELPPYLRQRVELEESLEQEYCSGQELKIPYLGTIDEQERVQLMAPYFAELIQ